MSEKIYTIEEISRMLAEVLEDKPVYKVILFGSYAKKKETFDKNLVALYRAGQYTPPGAETTSQVDKRVCSFVEDLFNTYKNNERILIVTHNGVMRSVKRNFVKSYEDIMSKNLGQIVLTDEDYKYYLERIKDKETAR